jgi:hypothetical protein
MSTELKTNGQLSHEIIESLVINGDLSKLTPQQKVQYYNQYCTTLGLNPVTQPFSLLTLNGKQKLYCGREGTAQLSKVYSVSHEIVSQQEVKGIYIVQVKARTGDRYTTSTGAVSIEGLKAEALCNAIMKAETKAKRRSTLDLLGLGMLDDSEIETIPGAKTEDISHTVMTDEALAVKLIESCKNIDDLTTAWKSLGSDMRKNTKCFDAKEAAKKRFTATVKAPDPQPTTEANQSFNPSDL